jgi:acyl-coenzyme A synthetase/AMP-(fatty) acid ligase
MVLGATGPVTYGDAVARSDALAAGLHARGVKRFAAVIDDVADAVALLAASTAVGAEACLYSGALDPASVAELAARFDHDLVITDRAAALDEVGHVALDALADDAPRPAPVRGGPAPVLILTTGTTGQPKGARHDWARLASSVRVDERQRAKRWLLAYNLNQFAGLQVMLHVLVNKATLVVPTSNQPRAALDAMLQHGVTHASATPTFWRFLTALLDGDVARRLPLEQLTLGGEAVPARLLAELRRLFPDARVSQVYASTEAGSMVSVRDAENGLPASVLSRGESSEAQMKIVDGELYIRSRVGMLGYYGESDHDSDQWQATGDLVEVRDDRIHFVGRASDTINVGGVKVHPLVVEERAASVDGVHLVRAYGRPNPLTGQIVALDVVPRAGADESALSDAIRQACASLPPAARPRRIRLVAELTTHGNKLVRQ